MHVRVYNPNKSNPLQAIRDLYCRLQKNSTFPTGFYTLPDVDTCDSLIQLLPFGISSPVLKERLYLSVGPGPFHLRDKHPAALFEDAVADKTRNAREYIFAMFADSTSHSVWSSCTIQSESIHQYCTSKLLSRSTAS